MVTVLLSMQTYSQRTLEWSIGEAKVTCGEPVHLCYPLMVSISDDSETPVLATTTMRMFYDASKLVNLTVQNFENGYSESGLKQSNPVFGEVFGFDNSEGVFVQFNIMDNAVVDPLMLSTSPTRVLDLCFDVDNAARYPLCLPIVFDNNHDGSGQGIDNDGGYLTNDAGVVGGYFLDKNYEDALAADDEVRHLSWERSNAFKGKLKKGKRVGQVRKLNCIKNICHGPDCDDDGIPDNQELDSDGDGTPDDCEDTKPGNGNGNGNGNGKSDVLFRAYPVPFDQEVFVKYKFDYDTDVTIEILDTKGTLIRQIKNKEYVAGDQYQQRVDLSKTANQLLFIKLTTNKEVSSKKIVSSSIKRRE